jgi:D-serine deaminase-like pyridoxal phosphate-dependent protein
MRVIGARKSELDTPALVVDLDVLDRNIGRISRVCSEHGVHWRPHIKGQKTPEVVRRELAAGAIGITCAKLGEAEAMVAAGIDNVLIANQVVGATKIGRLVELSRRARVMVAVDDVHNIEALNRAATEQGVRFEVVVEVDTGMKRAGVPPGRPAVDLARTIAATAGLRFAGLMSWEGHAARIPDPHDKRRAVADAVGALVATADLIRRSGLAVEIVSCGGTGTYPLTAAIPGVTEIQAGGGVFSDIAYRTLYQIDHPCALTVVTTVTSRPAPTRIVCDAGKKSMSGDTALPEPVGLSDVASVRLSAEHAIIDLARENATLRVGDMLEFVVGYSDTTVHLHDEMFAVRDGYVEAAWPIVARGKAR